jgi:hypothetical protein
VHGLVCDGEMSPSTGLFRTQTFAQVVPKLVSKVPGVCEQQCRQYKAWLMLRSVSLTFIIAESDLHCPINVFFLANMCFDPRDVIAKCFQFVHRMISGVLRQLSLSHAIHRAILPHPLELTLGLAMLFFTLQNKSGHCTKCSVIDLTCAVVYKSTVLSRS